MPGDKHPETIQQERQGAPKDKKIPVVCEECNTGWMSRLETAVIPILTPIIKGSFCAITPDRRRLIAEWLTLKTMVLEHDRAIGLKTAVG
jgi:hypothetical protein